MNSNTNNALNDLKLAVGAALEESRLAERRTVCKRFYLSEAEDARLAELCQGVSLSAFVRSKVFGTGVSRPRAIVPQIDRETYIQLTHLRSNVNQIAKAVNIAAQQGNELPLTQAYLGVLTELDDRLRAIGLQLSQATDQTREENDR